MFLVLMWKEMRKKKPDYQVEGEIGTKTNRWRKKIIMNMFVDTVPKCWRWLVVRVTEASDGTPRHAKV